MIVLTTVYRFEILSNGVSYSFRSVTYNLQPFNLVYWLETISISFFLIWRALHIDALLFNIYSLYVSMWNLQEVHGADFRIFNLKRYSLVWSMQYKYLELRPPEYSNWFLRNLKGGQTYYSEVFLYIFSIIV